MATVRRASWPPRPAAVLEPGRPPSQLDTVRSESAPPYWAGAHGPGLSFFSGHTPGIFISGDPIIIRRASAFRSGSDSNSA
eukprot:331974-Hanusia_phi.AAC.3